MEIPPTTLFSVNGTDRDEQSREPTKAPNIQMEILK